MDHGDTGAPGQARLGSVVGDVLDLTAGGAGPAAWDTLVPRALARGLTEQEFREEVERWTSIGAVTPVAGGLAASASALRALAETAAAIRSARHGALGGRARPVVLLSLFDGAGIARLGMDDLLAMASSPENLVASFFAEIDPILARAVERRWRAHAEAGRGPPHVWVAGDVWDLLRGTAEPLRAVLRAAPPGALLVIVAGSPCQQLTTAGTWGGRQGLAGRDSILFFAVPAVASAARALRPDLAVVSLLEQAGSTLRGHRLAMGEAFGLGEQETLAHSPIVDAGQWNHLPRRRMLLATVAPGPQPWAPPRRPGPWRPQWAPHWQGEMQPLMRAHRHEGDFVMARPYQYAARSLLYREGAGWGEMPLATAVRRIAALMPSELRRGWTLLNMGSTRGANERPASMAAEWVARHGESHGFRTPDLQERSRATGCGAYLESLGLGGIALYNAQGNHFDRAVVTWRLSRATLAWLQGGELPREPAPLGISDLERLYQRVRAAVDEEGIPTEPVAVPVDVQAAAAVAWGGAGGACGNLAAEDGRGSQ